MALILGLTLGPTFLTLAVDMLFHTLVMEALRALVLGWLESLIIAKMLAQIEKSNRLRSGWLGGQKFLAPALMWLPD